MLQNNDAFPSLTFARAGGGEIRLPDDLADGFGVILFYRGAWSDACNEQLHAFSQASDRIAAEGIKVVAISVDDRETTEALVERYDLTFPVGYAADAREVSAVTGILVNEDTAYLEATGFVINPNGQIHTAIYSSTEGFEERIVTVVYSAATIGRLMPDDVLRAVAAAKLSTI
jgi:peroxiredoxin